MGLTFCLIFLVPRPEETLFNNATAGVVSVTRQEGTDEQDNKEYIKPLPTILELSRTFRVPGTRYLLILEAENMHNEDDYVTMMWTIECAHPVVPADWDISFDPFQHVTDHFKIDFKINKPGVFLPTKPIIRLIEITGQQRIDNDIEMDNSTSFMLAHKDDNGMLPMNFPKCDAGCKTFIQLDKMGVNYLPDGAEVSGEDMNMGIYGTAFEVFVPTNIPPASPMSFGFNIQFYNPISSIKYTVPLDNYTRVAYTQTIQVLDPAPSGTGEWVNIEVAKWDYNWIEFYLPFAEPFTFEFGYTLPLEFGKDIFGMDFSLATKKWYIPACGVPYFNMTLEGTPRRIQYTFNNTDISEYQPPPCYVDWPSGAIEGLKRFSISHCPNIVSYQFFEFSYLTFSSV